jgi:hypothetical protein
LDRLLRPLNHPIISALWLKFSVRFRVDHGEDEVCSPSED